MSCCDKIKRIPFTIHAIVSMLSLFSKLTVSISAALLCCRNLTLTPNKKRKGIL